jgi:triosephosphate isomerase (TIM)
MTKSKRIPLMAGNWKSNLNHQEAVVLVQKLAWILSDKGHDPAKSEVAVLPPYTDLRSVQTLVDGDRLELKYGAQDVSVNDGGAYTGEISAAMLAKLGCTYVVLGHSERRQYHSEDDALVNAKAQRVLAADMTPIVCVGEGSLANIDAEHAAGLVVAYEPVWAIGTGEVATPEDAQEVCAAIRKRVSETWSVDVSGSMRILYGGSVKAANVAAIMAQPDVDGALVGGASLQADEFGAICRFYDLPIL